MQILIHSTSPEQARFFSRIKKALPETYDATFITNNILVYLYITLILKHKAIILNKFYHKLKPSENSTNNVEDIFYNYLVNTQKWDVFFMWNGSLSSHKGISKYAKKFNKKVLYFEISNIDNKLFVDTKGVNKNASLFSNINILKDFPVEKSDYELWKNNYINSRLTTKTKLNQSVNFNFKFYITKILKYIFNKIEIIFGFVTDFSYKKNTYFKDFFTKIKINFEITNTFENEYIFFPLQVSNDTQVVLNSDITVIDALKKAFDIVIKEDIQLVIKLHPAEQNKVVINQILDFAKKNNIPVSNKDSFELIQNSKKVITINSTVGLESKILEKDVIFLGCSFYDNLNQELLKNYLLSYLVDVNYFSNEPISTFNINKILERLK